MCQINRDGGGGDDDDDWNGPWNIGSMHTPDMADNLRRLTEFSCCKSLRT